MLSRLETGQSPSLDTLLRCGRLGVRPAVLQQVVGRGGRRGAAVKAQVFGGTRRGLTYHLFGQGARENHSSFCDG